MMDHTITQIRFKLRSCSLFNPLKQQIIVEHFFPDTLQGQGDTRINNTISAFKKFTV